MWLHDIYPSLNIISFHTVMLLTVCKGEEQLINSFMFPLTTVLVWLRQGFCSFQTEREFSKESYSSVLGPTGIELTSHTSPNGAVFCICVIARMVLITQQCFGYLRAVLPQHQGCLSNTTHHKRSVGYWWIRGWEEM